MVSANFCYLKVCRLYLILGGKNELIIKNILLKK